ncbi:MAG: hypothetical protein IJ020_05235 [Bacteroidaceae bacterium]|nr:hypothetical protein [Bacteroidaceae bacterium]
METLIQITGLQYACEGTDVATLMAELEGSVRKCCSSRNRPTTSASWCAH